MGSSKAGKTLATGSFWVTASELAQAAAELASSVVAARVLFPEDFGLMGIVMLFVAVLQALSHTGFDQALIQRRDDVEALMNSAWTIQVIRGLILATFMAIGAPFVADFYDEPRLVWLIWVCTGHVLLHGFGNVGLIFFSRDLDFRTLFVLNTIRAFAHAGISIPAILFFQNVWGLVVGLIASACVHFVVSYVAHPYRPRLEWDREKLGVLIRYGKWVTGMTFLGFVMTQGDDVFVSRYLGPAALGVYRMAYDLSNIPATKITHVISRVSFPTYARHQDDVVELRQSFGNVMRGTMLLSGTASVVIWMIVPDVVAYVVGDKWIEIVVLVRILVVSAFIRSFAALGGALFAGVDRPDLDFKMNLPRFAVVLTLIWPFCAAWGLVGASWVIVIALGTTLPIWFYGVRKTIGLGPVDVARLMALPGLNMVVLGTAFVAASQIPGEGPAFAVLRVVASVAVWVAAMWFIGRATRFDLLGEVRSLRAASR